MSWVLWLLFACGGSPQSAKGDWDAKMKAGNVAYQQHNVAAAATSFEEAIEAARAMGPEGSDKLTTALYRRARLEWEARPPRWDKALTFIEEAVEVSEKQGEHVDLARDLEALGRIQEALGNIEAAESAFIRAKDVRHKVQGPEHRDTLHAYVNIGRFYQRHGQNQQAVRFLGKGLEGLDKDATANAEAVVTGHIDMAIALREQGRNKPALDQLDKAMQVASESYPPAHPLVASIYSHQGELHRRAADKLTDEAARTARYEEAIAAFDQARSLCQVSMGDTDPACGLALHNLAATQRVAGKLHESLDTFEKALPLMREFARDQPLTLARTLAGLGLTLDELGKKEEAKPLLAEARKLDPKVLGP